MIIIIIIVTTVDPVSLHMPENSTDTNHRPLLLQKAHSTTNTKQMLHICTKRKGNVKKITWKMCS